MNPSEPTAAPAGTAERFATYEARYAAGLDLQQPGDADTIKPLEFHAMHWRKMEPHIRECRTGGRVGEE